MPDFGEFAEVNFSGGTDAAANTPGLVPGGNTSVLQLQMWLKNNGYDPGPLDGIMGPKTAAARDAAVLATTAEEGADSPTGHALQPAGSGDGGGSTTSSTPTTTSTPTPTGGGGGGTATSSTTGTAAAPTAPTRTDDVPTLSILDGRNRKWYRDGDRWYVGYGMEFGRELVFEATSEQMDALFGTGPRPRATSTSLKALTGSSGVTFAGSITEVEGSGWFEDEVDRVIALALDEGILPSWAQQDGAALDILFIAQSEQKSNDWVLQQLSGLDSFKARFPGLKNIQDLLGGDLETSIDAWLEFEQGTKQALAAYGKSDQVVNPAMVGELLAGGHSLTTIQTTIATFDRMEKFAPAFEAFNSILEAQGMGTMDSLDDMFQFASGVAPSEMYDVYEASSIAEAMDVAGLGDIFSAEDAIEIGLETEQTLSSATKAAQKSAEMLLRLRHEVNVGDFGLDHEELIDISFGRAARSGRSEAEIMDNITRAVTTAQQNIQTKRAEPYKAFSSQGTIQAASLGNLRQTS